MSCMSTLTWPDQADIKSNVAVLNVMVGITRSKVIVFFGLTSVLSKVFSNSDRNTGPFQLKRKAAREEGLKSGWWQWQWQNWSELYCTILFSKSTGNPILAHFLLQKIVSFKEIWKSSFWITTTIVVTTWAASLVWMGKVFRKALTNSVTSLSGHNAGVSGNSTSLDQRDFGSVAHRCYDSMTISNQEPWLLVSQQCTQSLVLFPPNYFHIFLSPLAATLNAVTFIWKYNAISMKLSLEGFHNVQGLTLALSIWPLHLRCLASNPWSARPVVVH